MDYPLVLDNSPAIFGTLLFVFFAIRMLDLLQRDKHTQKDPLPYQMFWNSTVLRKVPAVNLLQRPRAASAAPEACADVLPMYPVVAESFFAMAFTIIDEIHIKRAPHFQSKCFYHHIKKGRAKVSPAFLTVFLYMIIP
jgi:hypothetical protein